MPLLKWCLNFGILTTAIIAHAQNPEFEKTKESYKQTLPEGFLPYEAFAEAFTLGNTTTEKSHPLTKKLSQTMHSNREKGLHSLMEVDKAILDGLILFNEQEEKIGKELTEKLKFNGRIFFVGSGSSGRVGLDLAAKCAQYSPSMKDKIFGVIAGGDSALIRAKEGSEDSEKEGFLALNSYHLTPQDTVFLISASGSAFFNVGCGHAAADQGAKVYYFYNSQDIPERTRKLFTRDSNPVEPLLIDVGPQAVSGSTRLQGASVAEACLGSLLTKIIDPSLHSCDEMKSKLIDAMEEVGRHLPEIAQIVDWEYEVFSSPDANFKKVNDQSELGYVTFLANSASMREILTDSTESSPTFSTNPIRRIGENNQKREEFRAYLLEEKDNQAAWHAVLGRAINSSDLEETQKFILDNHSNGPNGYSQRPLAHGNVLIGVMKLAEGESVDQALIQELEKGKSKGTKVALIAICRSSFPQNERLNLQEKEIALLALEQIPKDDLGLIDTLSLKQTLNLISNGSMIMMNKVHGNQMIDVRASNNKLIDRCMRLTKEIWLESHEAFPLSDHDLYHLVAHIRALKTKKQLDGVYTPSVVKMALTLIAHKQTPADFDEALAFLNKMQESIEWIDKI